MYNDEHEQCSTAVKLAQCLSSSDIERVVRRICWNDAAMKVGGRTDFIDWNQSINFAALTTWRSFWARLATFRSAWPCRCWRPRRRTWHFSFSSVALIMDNLLSLAPPDLQVSRTQRHFSEPHKCLTHYCIQWIQFFLILYIFIPRRSVFSIWPLCQLHLRVEPFCCTWHFPINLLLAFFVHILKFEEIAIFEQSDILTLRALQVTQYGLK